MNWFSFFSYVLVSTFTPGPNNISSMSNASRYGFGASLRYRLGIFCGFFAVQLLAALFSATLLDYIPAAQPYMLALGAAYILWMAWKTLTSRSGGERPSAADNAFLSGVLLQFVNVKVIIFAVTTMSTFVLPHVRSLPALVLFASTAGPLSAPPSAAPCAATNAPRTPSWPCCSFIARCRCICNETSPFHVLPIAGARAIMPLALRGGVAERSKAAVLKTVERKLREFESLPLRHNLKNKELK